MQSLCKNVRSQCVLSALALVLAFATLQPTVSAATVRFQGRTYNVGIATLGTGNITVTGDLIFAQQGDKKFLVTPNDPNLHGDFDITAQRFYVLDRSNGQVNAFSSLDAALIDLTTFNDFSDTTQNPPTGFNGSNPLESFSKPLTIPSAAVPTDICIVEDTNLLGYRTDGPAITDEFVYSITRQAASTVSEQFAVALKNADLGNGHQNVFLEYDVTTNNYLLVQLSLDATNNASTVSRISAFARDGTLVSELILTQNAAFPNFSGLAGGLAEDPSTGTLYLLDRGQRQVVIFTPIPPALNTVSPTSGPIAGGTKVTLSGVNLPSDAKVFFDNLAATNVSVNATGDTITANTPAHSEGTVDITLSGSGLSTPLKLAQSYTYINLPPTVKLEASPNSGAAPLIVSFSVTASDADGTIATRIIDFGDNTSFTFPADLGMTTTSHTYAADGVYSARLSVKDNLGGGSSDTATIIVGATELILRSLSFVITDAVSDSFPSSKDALKMKGEIILPEDTILAQARLTVGFVNVSSSAATALTPCPAQLLIPDAFQAAEGGGEFCVPVDAKQRVNNTVAKFSIRPLKKRGFPANTHSFTFTGSGFPLRSALEDAGVLKPAGLERATVRIIVRLQLSTGTTLQYTRLAVVEIQSGKKTGVKLTRH